MKAKISIIAAVARQEKLDTEKVVVNRRKPVNSKDRKAIGVDNTLPWNVPEDLKQFKKLTMGCPIIMGRKTYESIGRPLPNRFNIVVSRNANLQIEGVKKANSLEHAITFAKQKNPEEIFIIGGAQIYKQAIEIADYIYLTEIDKCVKGDAFFPQFNKTKTEWREVERKKGHTNPLLENNQRNCENIRFHFVKYERKKT